MKNNSGQGTNEYLVILSVIIVIGIIVVSLSSVFLDSTPDIVIRSNDVRLQTGDITVSEILTTPSGNVLLELSSSDSYTINKIELSEDGQEFLIDNKLSSRQKEFFQVTIDEECEEGDYITKDLKITYTSEYGVEHKKFVEGVFIQCKDVILTEPVNTRDYNLAPEVNLVWPADNNISLLSNVDFNYTASDDKNFNRCSLFLDNELDQNDTDGYYTGFRKIFSSDGIYNWQIKCFDDTGNSTSSEERTIEISANTSIINNCLELQEINNDLDWDYKLISNIDCSDTINWNEGEGFVSIGNIVDQYTGNFNGQGYEINGLYINRPGSDYVGLFGYVRESSIKNLSLVDFNLSGNRYIGSAAGYIYDTDVNNVNSSGKIYASNNAVGLLG